MSEDDTKHQIESLTRELNLMRERYSKLADVHGRLQSDNSLLEERVLSLVETHSAEKTQLEQDLLDAHQKLIHLQDTVDELEVEKQRYKDDCNLAVRLLQQHPTQFVSPTASEHFKPKNESVGAPDRSSLQNSHSVVVPTFPPTFISSLPLLNTGASPDQPPPVDSLRLAETLFKTDAVHRYPSTHFLCAQCHRTLKCCDVSVQTNPDDHTRSRRMSLTVPGDELLHDRAHAASEPHHVHMTVQEYQTGSTRRLSQELSALVDAIPQMHHI